MKVYLYTDGGSRGNPGPSAIGVHIENESHEVLKSFGEAIGVKTCNEAEYLALLRGVRECLELGATEIVHQTDSMLVCKQMAGAWRCKDNRMQKLRVSVLTAANGIKMEYRWTGREDEKQVIVDNLVNSALIPMPNSWSSAQK